MTRKDWIWKLRRYSYVALAVLIAFLTVLLLRPSEEVRSPLGRSLHEFSITRDGSTRHVPIYTSQPIGELDVSVTRAVVIIHGRSINADDYFDAVAEAVAGVDGMIIVAPEFATEEEDPQPRQLFWGSGWAECDRSDPEAGRVRISSCAVLDEIIATIRTSFPNASEVVIAGFSAGGQMVTRYAATNANPANIYLVGAPSSYLYFNDRRPGPRCEGDNDYKYGLEDLSSTSYMDDVGAKNLLMNFGSARVLTLVGSDDDNPESPSLDKSCEANAQGADRVERWDRYQEHLEDVYGAAIFERHPFVEVKGVAHDGRAILNSPAARDLLSGRK